MRRLLAATLALCGGVAPAADWPQWLGPNRDGKSPETGLLDALPEGGPKLVWQIESAERVGTGYGSPAVVGKRLYIVGGASAKAAAPESVHCLDADTGKTVWSTPIPTAAGKFLDGWGGGPRSTPTVDGDKLYVLGATGDLVCLTTGGKVVWSKNLVADFGGKIPQWGYSESPLVDGPNVVVTPGNKGSVTALNKLTGEKVWTTAGLDDGAGYSSLVPTVVGGVRQYVTQTMSHGVGVAAADGKLLWTTDGIKRATAVIPTPVVTADNAVFFTSGYRAGCEAYQLEPDGTGTKATKLYDRSTLMSNHHGGVIALGGKIYGHDDGKNRWLCLDLKAGGDDPVWSSKELGKGSITYADGHFYCYDENKGTLAQIKASPEGWEETGRFTIPKLSELRPNQGKVWAHPVVADGHLYLRDYENLFCYKLKK